MAKKKVDPNSKFEKMRELVRNDFQKLSEEHLDKITGGYWGWSPEPTKSYPCPPHSDYTTLDHTMECCWNGKYTAYCRNAGGWQNGQKCYSRYFYYLDHNERPHKPNSTDCVNYAEGAISPQW